MINYSYYVDDNNVLTIWDKDNRTVAEISDCGNMTQKELKELVNEVITEHEK